jgi:hypothetical protein
MPRGRKHAEVEHGTLVAATVTTLTFAQNYAWVEVLNRSAGGDDIFFLVDPGATNPTVGGDDTYVVEAVGITQAEVPSTAGTATTVKLISAGTPDYTVIAYTEGEV